MGIDSLKPQRIFILSTQSKPKQPKPPSCLKDPDSPSQWSSLLILPTLLVRRKLPVPNALSSYGPTSRRTIFKTQKTSNSSHPTKRWQRYSVLTASVLLVWPNFFHPTFQDKLWLYSSDLQHLKPALFPPIFKCVYNSSARLWFLFTKVYKIIIYCTALMAFKLEFIKCMP